MDQLRIVLLASLANEEKVNVDKSLNAIENPEEYTFLINQLTSRIKREPNSAQLHELLGILLLEMGLSEEAQEVISIDFVNGFYMVHL